MNEVFTSEVRSLVAGEVKVPTRVGQMPAYRAMPAAGAGFPTILVVQEVFGVHEWIKDIVRRIANLGYFAIAPDKAAVAWYGNVTRGDDQGGKSALEIIPAIKAAVLGLYGGEDPGIPVDTVEESRDAMKAAGKTVEIVVYPDAPHGFAADYRPSYRKDAAADAWQRMTAWFRRPLA